MYRAPGPAGEAPAAEAPDAGWAGAASDSEPAMRTVVDGFHGRYPRGRPRLPDAEHRGRLHRECVAIEVDRSFPGLRVARVLDRLHAATGLPQAIIVDNAPFAERTLDACGYAHGAPIYSTGFGTSA